LLNHHGKIPSDGARPAVQRHRKSAVLVGVVRTSTIALSLLAAGCSHDRPPAPAPPPSASAAPPERTPRVATVETPKQLETATAYRARFGPGAELYLPPWFSAKKGGYDLILHFHGVGRWQEANIERAKLNVAVVSINLGAGTEPYSNTFKSPDAFDKLLADTNAEIAKSARAEGAQVRRIALSAWSAGFSSISRMMSDAVAQRVDAILLADGFFTFFTVPKKRTVNAQGLEKFARFAEAAGRDEKLFAITHTTIPTGPYPSVQECVTKLLEMIDLTKKPASHVGPRNMHQFYTVDRGSFHIRGYQGTLAADHVKQLHAMGETVYPYLKSRWDKQDADEANAASANATASATARPPPAAGQPRAAP
jgi:hypothetical protein